MSWVTFDLLSVLELQLALDLFPSDMTSCIPCDILTSGDEVTGLSTVLFITALLLRLQASDWCTELSGNIQLLIIRFASRQYLVLVLGSSAGF